MSAGKLNRRVMLQKREMTNPDAPNDYGNTVADWQDQDEVWAGFTFLRGGESVMAGRLQGRQPAVVRLRASPITRQVASDWRLIEVSTGVAYAVRSVNPDPEGDRAFLDLLVEAGVAA